MRITHITFHPNGIVCQSTNAIGAWYWPSDDPRSLFYGLDHQELATADIRVTRQPGVSTTGCPLDDCIIDDIAGMTFP